jgi:hypothetical protein
LFEAGEVAGGVLEVRNLLATRSPHSILGVNADPMEPWLTKTLSAALTFFDQILLVGMQTGESELAAELRGATRDRVVVAAGTQNIPPALRTVAACNAGATHWLARRATVGQQQSEAEIVEL